MVSVRFSLIEINNKIKNLHCHGSQRPTVSVEIKVTIINLDRPRARVHTHVAVLSYLFHVASTVKRLNREMFSKWVPRSEKIPSAPDTWPRT